MNVPQRENWDGHPIDRGDASVLRKRRQDGPVLARDAPALTAGIAVVNVRTRVAYRAAAASRSSSLHGRIDCHPHKKP